MSSSESRRRFDLKTKDREKSLSPLDKDQLKQRCLERVRRERSRHIARLRQRRDITAEERVGFEIISPDLSPKRTGSQADESLPPERFLSSPQEILRQGLNEMAAGKRRQPGGGRSDQKMDLSGQGGVSCIRDAVVGGEPSGNGLDLDARCEPSTLRAIEEEAAYMTTFSPGARAVRPTAPGRDSHLCRGEERCNGGERVVDMDSEDLWFEDDELPDERLLSREEYLEMMQYIENACKEEDLRAEAEVLEEYELNRRLEEEAMEAAVASGLEIDGSGKVTTQVAAQQSLSILIRDKKDDGVLCPICKRNYLLEAGPPSTSIVCTCGFRLDTAGDRLGLEDLRKQLAETFEQHSAACNAQPGFSLEGSHGLTILWSSCDGCGFARVVL